MELCQLGRWAGVPSCPPWSPQDGDDEGAEAQTLSILLDMLAMCSSSQQQEMPRVPALVRSWEALSPRCLCTFLQQIFIFSRESENKKSPSSFSPSIDTSKPTDTLLLGKEAFWNELYSKKFLTMPHVFIFLAVWFISVFSGTGRN